MISILNLLFVPAVLLSVLYRRENRTATWSPQLILDYLIAAACNLPAAKALVVLVRVALQVEISIDSAYYTVLALLSAVLLPYLLEFFRKSFKITCTIEENHEKQK